MVLPMAYRRQQEKMNTRRAKRGRDNRSYTDWQTYPSKRAFLVFSSCGTEVIGSEGY